MNRRIFVGLLVCVAFVLLTAAGARLNVQLSSIKLPPGFTISVFATGVKNARSMTLGTKGTVFVGTMDAGNVYALVDRNKSGHADEVITIARGLNMPNGVAFRDGALYVAELNRIWRYDDIEARLKNPPKPQLVYSVFRQTGTMAGSSSPSAPTECSIQTSAHLAMSAAVRTHTRRSRA